MSQAAVEGFPLSSPLVVTVLALLTALYQLNARVTPWSPWHVRRNGRYMRSWWSYAVLNWAGVALVVALVLSTGAPLAVVRLSPPAWDQSVLLVVVSLAVLALYYREVVERPPLDETVLERIGDGWTPATRRQRLLGVVAFGLTPGSARRSSTAGSP